MKHWTPRELNILRGLRERFLTGTAGVSDYWKSGEELALYDTTFAERIGWKWDAVLEELRIRGWRPKSRHVLDWGCGSGVAGRRVLANWAGCWQSLLLHDRSALAMQYAAAKAKETAPSVEVRVCPEVPERLPDDTLLVVSHVGNELQDQHLDSLLAIATQAREILWVEAGTHADSRRLSALRERLRAPFSVVAPCTHQERCGMLSQENSRHWCHHFAPPPSGVFQDARWAELGKELGIDLRALPYSFLVLQQREGEPASGPEFSRVIGAAREFKGFHKVLSCGARGVEELMLQKRDAPQLYREIGKGAAVPVYHWHTSGSKITGADPLPE